MSTNKSQNLKLHLWEPEDNFLRTEFNENFAAIDAAVKADRTAITKAQSTADTALSKANAAYAPDQKPYVVGSYTGESADMTFNIGFRPSFLIISGAVCHSATNSCSAQYVIITRGNTQSKAVTFTNTGFIIHDMTDARYPDLTNPHNYDYIVFR